MTHTPDNAAVWFELPVRDMTKAIAFYNAALDTELALEPMGPVPMATFPARGGVAGHIYPGVPATDGAGLTVHLAVPGRLEDTMARWTAAGGTLKGGVVAIPPGRYVYASDPDGNPIGLFEPKAA